VRLPELGINDNALHGVPLRHKTVLFCPLPGPVCHLKWWVTKFSVDHVDIFHMNAEMGNDEPTEMQPKFQDSKNLFAFVATPNVGWTRLNHTSAMHAVIIPKFWVLNEQQQVFV
jgi:hypothetical protein